MRKIKKYNFCDKIITGDKPENSLDYICKGLERREKNYELYSFSGNIITGRSWPSDFISRHAKDVTIILNGVDTLEEDIIEKLREDCKTTDHFVIGILSNSYERL